MKSHVPFPKDICEATEPIDQPSPDQDDELSGQSSSEQQSDDQLDLEQVPVDAQEDEANVDEAVAEDPFLEVDNVVFSVSYWYKMFEEITPTTYIIEMAAEIVDMFTDDNNSIIDVTNNSQLNGLCAKLDVAIATVGGVAFVKNNWHAPKDAAMFSLNHLLKATNSREALSYLMYSDIVLKDFDKQLGDMQFCISVRPWMDIHPASEFRCIVVRNEIVAITPREWPKYYAHYKDIMPTLIQTVNSMFQQNIQYRFSVTNYIFDIVFISPNNCMLWDISPLNESTTLHAFMWEEIKSIVESPGPSRTPVFRYLAEDSGILPSNMAFQQHY